MTTEWLELRDSDGLPVCPPIPVLFNDQGVSAEPITIGPMPKGTGAIEVTVWTTDGRRLTLRRWAEGEGP
jgi:hypothetical protein